MIKKGNVRLTLSLGGEHITALNDLKKALKTKNNAKAIKYLLDMYVLQKKV